MRIGDVLYFSPNFRFQELDFDKPDLIASAFEDRVKGFYLEPAQRLVDAGDAFAAGLVILAAVDFVAAKCSEENAPAWMAKNLNLEEKTAETLWVSFRHGLTHEGRVKPSGQFSMGLPNMVTPSDGIIIVNPRLLLEKIIRVFADLCANMSVNRKQLLREKLRRLFEEEARASKI